MTVSTPTTHATTTTTTTKTWLVVTPYTSPTKKSSSNIQSPPSSSTPSHYNNLVPCTPSFHPVPKPEDLRRPADGETVDGYYVITLGRECGIFFEWHVYTFLGSPKIVLMECRRSQAHARVRGLKESCYKSHPSWDIAYARYCSAWESGIVQATPERGSQFWMKPQTATAIPSSSVSGSVFELEPSSAKSLEHDEDSDSELWTATSIESMDDDQLSAYFQETMGFNW